MLYYGVGKYISLNSRKGFWGKGAVDAISKRLDKELPGLRGFSARNLRNMRIFYEEWISLDSKAEGSDRIGDANLADTSANLEDREQAEIWQTNLPNKDDFPMEDFLHIGFSHHTLILSKVKDYEERLFYIRRTAGEKLSYESLKERISRDEYHHQGSLPNNFVNTIASGQQALKAVSVFKDEYLLDYINVEEIDVRDKEEVDEKVIENDMMLGSKGPQQTC